MRVFDNQSVCYVSDLFLKKFQITLCKFVSHFTVYFHIFSEQGSVEGLAYDPVHRDLYWTSHTDNSLSRINLAAKNSRPEVIIHLGTEDRPRGIDVDSCAS